MTDYEFLTDLRQTNSARLAVWEGDQKTDALFHATELGGEVGEVLNVVKKLHREAMGWRGSRSTVSDLSDEIGDVMICLDKLAARYDIDIAEATRRKFNATSDKVGLPQKLVQPFTPCRHCGAYYPTRASYCAPPFQVQPHDWSAKP
jgi:NTP pyrophosphatase (non-canonical NTP hydrolase)